MEDAEKLTVDVQAYVASEIRANLARRRISPTAAARRLGWHQTQMSRRLAGQQPISVDHIHEIAELLDMPVERFFPPRRRSDGGRIIGPRPSRASRLVALAC